MHIYLKHPDHGTKIATMEEEAIFDESKGWVRYTPGEPEIETRRRGRTRMVDNDDGGRSDQRGVETLRSVG